MRKSLELMLQIAYCLINWTSSDSNLGTSCKVEFGSEVYQCLNSYFDRISENNNRCKVCNLLRIKHALHLPSRSFFAIPGRDLVSEDAAFAASAASPNDTSVSPSDIPPIFIFVNVYYSFSNNETIEPKSINIKKNNKVEIVLSSRRSLAPMGQNSLFLNHEKNLECILSKSFEQQSLLFTLMFKH